MRYCRCYYLRLNTIEVTVVFDVTGNFVASLMLLRYCFTVYNVTNLGQPCVVTASEGDTGGGGGCPALFS